MTTIQKMDAGLRIVYDSKKILEKDWIEKMTVDVVALGGIIDMLEADGYIKSIIYEEMGKKLLAIDSNVPPNYYTYTVITIKGDLFWNSGGYKGRRRREFILETLQLSMTMVIALGTVVAAVYYLRELVKDYQWSWGFDWNQLMYSPLCVLVVFLLGICTCIGIQAILRRLSNCIK